MICIDDIIKNLLHENIIDEVEFNKSTIKVPDRIVERVEEFHRIYSENNPTSEQLLHDWSNKKQNRYAFVDKLYSEQHGGEKHGKLILAGFLFCSSKNMLGFPSAYDHRSVDGEYEIEYKLDGKGKRVMVDLVIKGFTLGRNVPRLRIWCEAGNRKNSNYFEERVWEIAERIYLDNRDIFIHVPESFEDDSEVRFWTVDNLRTNTETNIHEAFSKELDKIPDDP